MPVAMATSICRLRSADGLLDGRVGFDLIGPEPWVIVGDARRGVAGRVEVRSSISRRAAGVWKCGDPPGAVERVADVVEPDHLAVGRVEERHAEAVEVEGPA